MSNYNVEKDGYEKLPYAYPITSSDYNPDYQNDNQNKEINNCDGNNQKMKKNQNTAEYLNDEEIAVNLSRELNEQPETRVVIIDRRTNDDSLATSCCLGGALAMLCCTIQ